MVRKLGPRFHRVGSLFPRNNNNDNDNDNNDDDKGTNIYKRNSNSKQHGNSVTTAIAENDVKMNETCKETEEKLFHLETTVSDSETIPSSPSDSATIVGSPVSTRASSPFEAEIKSPDYFSEFTTLSKTPSSVSYDSTILTPDYPKSPNLPTLCNMSISSCLNKSCNSRISKKKPSKKGVRKSKYEQIITFNGSTKLNDVIKPEIASNVKSEYTFVEERPIYIQEQDPPNLEPYPPYFNYGYEDYKVPNGPLKNGGSGDVYLTEWIGQDFD